MEKKQSSESMQMTYCAKMIEKGSKACGPELRMVILLVLLSLDTFSGHAVRPSSIQFCTTGYLAAYTSKDCEIDQMTE